MSIVQSIIFGSASRSSKQGTAAELLITDPDNRYNAKNVDAALTELGETKTWNGFDLYHESTWPAISWDDATRTLTLSPKVDTFHFWANGKKITKSSSETIQLPDVTGTYYVWYDNDGNLAGALYTDLALETFYDYALAAGVYWNATDKKGFAGSELHGKDMASRTHIHDHLTFGALYSSGYAIEGLSKGSVSHGTLTAGSFFDEDIHHSGLEQTAMSWMYRGPGGEYKVTAADNNVALYDPAQSKYVYNHYNGTSWELLAGTSSTDFWVNYVMLMPSLDGYTAVKVPGQNAYGSRGAARDAIEGEIRRIKMDGLPLPEFVFIYAWIVKRNGQLQSLEDNSLYLDYRTARGGQGVAVDHKTVMNIFNVTGEQEAVSVSSKYSFRMPFLMSIKDIRASVVVSPSGSDIIIDILIDGVSIFDTTKLHIDDGDLSSVGSSSVPDYVDTSVSDDSLVEVVIDQVGSTVSGSGLRVYFVG